MATVKTRDLGERAGSRLGLPLIRQYFSALADLEGMALFIAPFKCRIVEVRYIALAATGAGSFMLQTASGNVLAANANYSDANTLTVVTPALHATEANLVLAAGTSLSFVNNSSPTTLTGLLIQVLLMPVPDRLYWRSF